MKEATVTPIETEEQLSTYVLQSEQKLIIIDVHLKWTGRCETLTPTFETMMVEHQKSDDRIDFISLEIPKFSEPLVSLLEQQPAGKRRLSCLTRKNFTKILCNLDVRGCRPLFVLIRNETIVAIVEGADPPALTKVVEEHIPRISDGDEDE